jgi:hypothetical protein
MDEPQLSQIITVAVTRLRAELSQAAPYLAGQVEPWLLQLAGSNQPADYFRHPLAFPALLLPWWLEQTIHPQPDPAFQADLAYSTINGYYYIRLIDNLMDGHATVELALLPALGFFHSQFQLIYQHYFAADQPFWDFFITTWLQSAEVTFRDADLTNIDEATFKQVTAKKVGAAKIPLAAVCYRYNRPELIAPWSELVDQLGGWHQFLNDLLSWHRDHTRQTCTYFLSEAERRRAGHEPVVRWVAREGFDWAMGRLQEWLAELQALALELHSPALNAYLTERGRMLQQQQAEVAEGLAQLTRMLNLNWELPGRS